MRLGSLLRLLDGSRSTFLLLVDLLMLCVMPWVVWATWRIGVVVDPQGLSIRRELRTIRLRWEKIRSVEQDVEGTAGSEWLVHPVQGAALRTGLLRSDRRLPEAVAQHRALDTP